MLKQKLFRFAKTWFEKDAIDIDAVVNNSSEQVDIDTSCNKIENLTELERNDLSCQRCC